ncbi:hypothetical protein ACWCPQ_14370 [Nocardia sp. NPDC001965]
MTENPFETAADEAQTEAPADPTPEPTKEAPKPRRTAVKKTAAVEESGEGKVTVTLKGGSGHGAPWIVIHAADVQDAYDQFEGDNATLLAQLMTKVANAGKHFAGLSPAAPAQDQRSGGGQQRSGGGAPAGATQAPNGEKRFCAHGEMEFKSGVSQKGNAYKLFSCTAPRNEQCDAQYLK